MYRSWAPIYHARGFHRDPIGSRTAGLRHPAGYRRLVRRAEPYSVHSCHPELSCPGGAPPTNENGFPPAHGSDKLTMSGTFIVRPEPVEGRPVHFQRSLGPWE